MTNLPIDKLSHKIKFLLKIHICTLLFALGCILNLSAQNLGSFAGFYQLQQNKELHVQILVVGNQLKLRQQWDYKEIVFDRKSDSSFYNAKTAYPLNFVKDKQGKINGVIGRGGDVWERAPNYRPKPLKEWNAKELAQLKVKLDAKALGLVRAINANSTAACSTFVAQHFSESLKNSFGKDFVNRLAFMYRATGGLNKAENLSINPFTQLAEYRCGSYVLNNLFEFSLKLDQHGKIELFNNRLIANKDSLEKTKTTKEMLGNVWQTLQKLDKKDIFSGTVLIAKKDKVLLEYACGDAEKEGRIKNNINTKINIGSMNKMFTATAIMQLAEHEKLSLDDKISGYLDTTWLPNEIARKVTIAQLLSHTSGLGDFFGEEFDKAPQAELRTLNGFKPFIKKNRLAFEPGTNWAYSNSGMLLLGAIIEKVTGESYFDYVLKNIYGPAGMTSSNLYNLDENPTNTAIGYIPKPAGGYANNRNKRAARGSAAGGGYSTVLDLYQFAKALNAGKLVSATSQKKMFTDYMNRQYGYGFQLWNPANAKVIGHSGGAEGINGVLYIFPDNGYVIAVLSNYDRGAQLLGEYLLNEVARLKDQ